MGDWLIYGVIVCFASGIFIRSLFFIDITVIVWLLLLALGVGIVGWLQRTSMQPLPIVCIGSLMVVMLCLGMWRLDYASRTVTSPTLAANVGSEVVLTGTVRLAPDIRERSQHLYLQLDVTDDSILVITDRYEPVSYGDRLQVVGFLSEPEAFTTDLGRTFDYPGYLRAKGVQYLVRYPETLVILAADTGNPIIAGLLSFKAWFQSSLRQYVPAPQVALAEGLLLGEKQGLGADWNELFRRTGVIHIVVLSGYNVMLVVGFFLFVLSFFVSPRLRALGALVGVVCFALLVGLSPTVTRASVMAGLLLIALLLGRSYAIMRALLLAGVVMLVANPYLLVFDPGFQLSFMATLGLIIVAPYFESLLLVSPHLVSVRDYVIATVATQVAVLPLLLYHIGEISLVSVLVNVLVLPMVPLAMLLTFLTGMVGAISSTLGMILGFVTYWSLQYILTIVAIVGAWPLAAISVPYFPATIVFAMYAALGYWWWRRLYRTQPYQNIPAMTAPVSNTLATWTIDELVDTKTGATARVAPARSNIFLP